LLAELHFKWNRHVWDVKVDTLSLGLRMVMTTELLFTAATTLTKCSMLSLTYRVIGSSSSTLRNIAIVVMTVVALQGAAFFFVVIFQCRYDIRSLARMISDICRRPSDYWTLSFEPQKCLSQTTNLLVAGIINTFTDFLVVILPIPLVWGLRLPRRQQIILVLLFGAGFMVTIAGCVRTVHTYRVSISYDQTWMAFPVWISSSVELYVGVVSYLNSCNDFSDSRKQIGASVPPTRKFFSRYIPKLLGSSILSQSRTAASHPSKGTHKSNPNYSHQGEDLELGITHAGPNLQPHEAKSSEDSLRVEALANALDFESTHSSYAVENMERVGTAKSCRSDGTDGIYDTQRGESDDELCYRVSR
jgi:hypothetical protein